MKFLRSLIFFIAIFSSLSLISNNPNCKNSSYILAQSQQQYDAQNHWTSSSLNIHIQEPRVGNTSRHTKLNLDNSRDYFEMQRYREDGVVKRILTKDGDSKIFLNGRSDYDESTINKYNLNTQRTINHKNFYKLMYGLPMSINSEIYKSISPAEKGTFGEIEVYRVALELKEEMISKHWTLLIGVKDYKLKAIEFNHPEDLNMDEEIITFDDDIEIDGMKLPRIRNWYIKGTGEYLGTDIIMGKLQ